MKLLLLLVLGIFSIGQCQPTRILSLDGGGIRGVATVRIMEKLEKETGVDFEKDFDVYAGTSTGALIAVSLACGVKLDYLLADYKTMSKGIFSQKHYFTLFRPEYSPDQLKSYVVQTLHACGYGPNATLGELPKKIVIPTVSLDDPKTGRWKLVIRENFTEEGKKTKIVDAVLESTAAPTYFPSEKGCVDGGMGMNDPSLAALMTLYQPGVTDFREISLFSIGTGYTKNFVKGDENWGMKEWLLDFASGSSPLLSLLMDVEEEIPSQVCAKFLGTSFMKYNFPLTEEIALDAFSKMETLLKYLDRYISDHPEEWSKTGAWLKPLIATKSPAKKLF